MPWSSRKLRSFVLLTLIFAGGATGMIGDPSGKSEERKLLERETLTREDFVVLMRGEKLPPRPPASPATNAAPAPSAPIPVAEPRRSPPILGGPEVAPA